MENIIEPSVDFDFSKLYLANPTSLSGGAYFTRMFLNNKPLYIQTPKCLTKQGFVKSGKKIYADLMFNNNDTIIIQWLENLETKCHELIHSKGTSWFDNVIDKSDIESAFTSPIKIFKSGKFYLLRVSVKTNVKIYNETDEILTIDSVKPETNIISILEIQGIKFTSRYFQIEIELKQSMAVSPDPFLDECFIKKPLNRNNDNLLHLKPSSNSNSTNVFKIDNTFKEERKEQQQQAESEYKQEPEYKQDLEQNKNTNLGSNMLSNIDLNIDFNEDEDLHDHDYNETENTNDFLQIEAEDLNKEEVFENINELTEFNLNNSNIDNNSEPMTLKKPNQVYYKIYKTAREKAKLAKKEAILAFLEAKNIKTTYMLEDMIDSDSDTENELDSLHELS